MPENSEWGTQTGTVTAGAEGESLVLDPPDLQLPGYFVVNSGPCTVAEGGRCVGRWPGGYLPNEDCTISVGGVGGALGPCPVFDIYDSNTDSLTLPDGSMHHSADCPAGTVLAAGQTLAWHSNTLAQGNGGDGLPFSRDGAGGGWQICF